MRIVDALTTKNHLTAAHDPNSQEQRQARHERHAARHAHAVVLMLNEIPRRELDFDALGGRVIEHVASANGTYYRPWGGDPAFRGDDVRTYYVNEHGSPVMLERCQSPSSRHDLERRQALKLQRRQDQQAATKERYRQLRETTR